MRTDCSFLLHDLHEIRPRLVSPFVMSCFPWDHTGFSGRIFLSLILAMLGLNCCSWLLYLQSSGYSVIAAHWLSILCFSRADHRLWGTQAQELWLTSLVTLGHLQSSQTRSQRHILSTGSKGKTLWKEFEIHHFYMKLGTMAYLWGDWWSIVPHFKQPPETRTDLGSPPKCFYSILTVLPCGFVLAWVSETHTRP